MSTIVRRLTAGNDALHLFITAKSPLQDWSHGRLAWTQFFSLQFQTVTVRVHIAISEVSSNIVMQNTV